MNTTHHAKQLNQENGFWSVWSSFVWERHNPLVSVAFTFLFVLAHYFMYGEAEFSISTYKFMALIIGVFAFLFKLRLFDEIKDFEHDSIAHPDRPLVRGSIFHLDLYQGITVLTIFEFVTFGLFGWASLTAIVIADSYAFLMFKEFYLRLWIRERLIIYAITHTLVAAFLSLAVHSALSSEWVWSFGFVAYLFAAMNWLVFNVYEFGRKSFTEEEENKKADSYSRKYGRSSAPLLASVNGILVVYLTNMINASQTTFLIVTMGILSSLATLLVAVNKKLFGMMFRVWSLAFIAAFYVALIVSNV